MHKLYTFDEVDILEDSFIYLSRSLDVMRV